MRLIDDLPNTGIEEEIIKRNEWKEGSLFDMTLRKALKNATPIPDNATNGDVLRIMFPVSVFDGEDDNKYVGFYTGDGVKSFPLDWWNAPYKKGEEE